MPGHRQSRLPLECWVPRFLHAARSPWEVYKEPSLRYSGQSRWQDSSNSAQMLMTPEWPPRWCRSRQELFSFCDESSLCWYAVFDLKLPLPEGMSMAAQIVRAAFAMKVWFPYLALAERRMAESAVPAADRLDTPLPA